ncbi:hypothetical protein [Caldiplasma sukawensis]
MDTEVEFTNNMVGWSFTYSEIYRRGLGQSGSERFYEFYTKVYSIHYTSKLRGINSWIKLHLLLKEGLNLTHRI